MRLLGGPACTGHCLLHPVWPPCIQQAHYGLLSLGHPHREQGPNGTCAPPGQPHGGADLQNQRVTEHSPLLWGGGGRGLHWTHGPGCTSDTCGLPRWTESLLLPWAKLGSSLNQPLDLICGNCSLAWHSRQRRHQGLHDLRGWVLGSPPINRVPTSPKAPDLHWCQRGGTGRTQKKGGDLPSACQGPRGNKVRPLKGGTCQSLVRGHAKSPGVGGLACREFHICSLYQNSKKVGLDLGEGSGIRASAEMEPKWVLGVKGELWAG